MAPAVTVAACSAISRSCRRPISSSGLGCHVAGGDGLLVFRSAVRGDGGSFFKRSDSDGRGNGGSLFRRGDGDGLCSGERGDGGSLFKRGDGDGRGNGGGSFFTLRHEAPDFLNCLDPFLQGTGWSKKNGLRARFSAQPQPAPQCVGEAHWFAARRRLGRPARPPSQYPRVLLGGAVVQYSPV